MDRGNIDEAWAFRSDGDWIRKTTRVVINTKKRGIVRKTYEHNEMTKLRTRGEDDKQKYTSVHKKHMSMYVHMYSSDFFVRFQSNLLVWALLNRTLSKEVDTGRPSGRCVVKVWARYKHCCISRGVRSKFFPAGVDKTTSWGFCMRPYFISIRTYDSSCFMHGAQPAARLCGMHTAATVFTAVLWS